MAAGSPMVRLDLKAAHEGIACRFAQTALRDLAFLLDSEGALSKPRKAAFRAAWLACRAPGPGKALPPLLVEQPPPS